MKQPPGIKLRSWEAADREALVRYANNRNVWINLTDVFPHPYTQDDADGWLARCAKDIPPSSFAIDLAGTAIGGVGIHLLTGVYRLTAEIGYWVGEPFWGRGIATEALRQASDYAFKTFGLERLQAHVFDWNPASARVLEKAGYHLEGRLRRYIIKDGRITDSLIYARLRQSR